ncbi:hypothetical protein N7G274_003764 [Stereocaulon virgatum]|uniref:C2H2-type domain-containing protein n=1 Tax=Stereocaulon virgatum TaxID=373712 RepID=A0ABR4AFT5_9LECA
MDQLPAVSDLGMHLAAAEDRALGPLYVCLHGKCNASFPTANHLNSHIETHFKDPRVNHDIHPFNGLAAVHAAANLDDYHVVVTGHINYGGQAHSAPTLSNATVDPSSSTQASGHRPNNNNTQFACSRCGGTFGRVADLQPHAKKHNPAMRTFRCDVTGCKFEGSYRKDKLDAHARARHQ